MKTMFLAMLMLNALVDGGTGGDADLAESPATEAVVEENTTEVVNDAPAATEEVAEAVAEEVAQEA